MRAEPNQQRVENVIVGERIPDPLRLSAGKPKVSIGFVECDGLLNCSQNRPHKCEGCGYAQNPSVTSQAIHDLVPCNAGRTPEP
jgi:hypothetical protein